MNDFIEVDGQEYVSMERYRELSAYCQQLKAYCEALKEDLDAFESKLESNHQRDLQFIAEVARLNGRERDVMILFNIDHDELRQLADEAVKRASLIPKYEPGYIYVIQDVDVTGYCKIGRSVDPASRLRHFGVKLPFSCEMIHMFKVNNMFNAETSLHKKYKGKRVRGEWFNLTSRDIRYIKSLKDE